MSMHIQINFVQTAWYKLSYVTRLGASLTWISLIFFCVVFAYQQILQSKQLEIQRAKIATQRISPKVNKNTIPQPSLNHEQKLILTEMVHRLNAPWESLFNAIEKMQNADIALVSVIPNLDKEQLELSGEARNLNAIFAYIESLETLPMLEHVTLLKHQIIDSHPYQPVEFSILARWKE